MGEREQETEEKWMTLILATIFCLQTKNPQRQSGNPNIQGNVGNWSLVVYNHIPTQLEEIYKEQTIKYNFNFFPCQEN